MRQPRAKGPSAKELTQRLAKMHISSTDQLQEIKALREVLSLCHGVFLALTNMPNADRINAVIESVLYDPPPFKPFIITNNDKKEDRDGYQS